MGYTMLYCVLKGKTVEEKVIKSIDFENWEITNEEVPQIVGNIMMKENDISARGYDFIVLIMKKQEIYFILYFGDWIVDKDEEEDFLYLMIIFIL